MVRRGVTGSFVALLRGINVGGKRPIRMSELIECFETLGYENARTYLQSGNVLFTGGGASALEIEHNIEQALERQFGFAVPVVLQSRTQMERVVEDAPTEHGAEHLRSDVIFVKHPLTAEDAFAQLPELREGVDSVALGPGVIYFSRVSALASKTRMTKMMALPMYQQVTVRNWNTVTNVTRLLSD